MSDVRRFEAFRFLGDRATMTVYDTEDSGNAALLAEKLDSEDLVGLNQIQTFGPDTLAEARNRGFKPVR